jgi:DNA replication and repair protein RecF
MVLSKLSLVQFRNYAEQQVSFSPKINLIFGSNGHGKTNLIEAIHVLALSKSFRTHQAADLISRGSQEFYLVGEVLTEGRKLVLSLEQNQTRKVLQVNNSKQDVFSYVQYLPLVAFSTAHIEQFKSESEQRRRLIDRGLYQLQPTHLRRLSEYYRVIRQKNSLLRKTPSVYNRDSAELIEVWNLQIADLGARIIESRSAYIDKISSKLADASQQLTPEVSDVRYVACNEIISKTGLVDIKDQLYRKLIQNRDREIRLGRSLVGPHRDEILIEIDGKSAQRYASAGQFRSSLLAYYMAQIEVAFERQGEYPVFLIDDVDSELDKTRIHRLLSILEGKTQVFVTTTKPELIQMNCPAERVRAFRVESGCIKEVSSQYIH